MMAKSPPSGKPALPPALEARLLRVLRATGGTMPITMVVGSQKEKRAFLAALRGRKRAKLVDVELREEEPNR